MNDNLEFYIKGKDFDSPHIFINPHDDGVWISLNRPGGSCWAVFPKSQAQQLHDALTAILASDKVTA